MEHAAMEVVSTERKSPVLTASKLPCLATVPMINLTAGCAHGCLYCYAQGYCGYPGRGKIVVYSNLLEKLRQQLDRMRHRPKAVCFSPSSDLFQPVPEVLDLAFDVLEFLFRSGIGVIFLTKGKIPKPHMELLKANAVRVRAHIGILSLNGRLVRVVEPHCASPKARLEQMRQLVEAGVETAARLDPILPGVTDDPDSLHALCAAVSEAGVKEISASTLFLRPAVIGSLRRQIGRSRTLERLLDSFDQGKRLKVFRDQGSILALSGARRRKIFDWLTAIARQYGITVHVCGCKNPDIAAGSCNLSGRWSPPAVVERQLALFAT